MRNDPSRGFSLEELERQHIAEHPRRDLMAGVGLGYLISG